MRHLALLFVLSMTSAAWAAGSEAPAVTTVHKDDTRLLGRLNANLATREELAQIPSLESADIERIVEARARGPLSSLAHLGLPEDACARLVVSGPSTLRRIRQLPLEVYSAPLEAATR